METYIKLLGEMMKTYKDYPVIEDDVYTDKMMREDIGLMVASHIVFNNK